MIEKPADFIESFLIKKIGLDPAALGKNSIAMALNARMVATGINDFTSYYLLLMSSPKEEQELIESLIIPETWFFRGKSSFNFLSDYLRTEWPIVGANKLLNILSMPCSTGEEPYSIAMTLLDSGLRPRNYNIDALDISVRSLQKAKDAIYRENSFRGPDINFRQSYFEKNKKGDYILNQLVRENVHFFYGNLADPAFRCGPNRYQVIFCRNLLIYLIDVTKKHIFSEINTLLEDDGILITSPAEFDLFLTWGYEPVKYPQACAFRKPIHKFVPSIEKKILVKEQMPFANSIPKSTQFEGVTLEKVSQLANNGHLENAMALCEDYISHHHVDSKGYFFLGMLQYTQGKEELAVDSLQKALYLDPDHYESLIYLSLLEEKRGEKQQAALLRQRAQKNFQKDKNKV